MPGLAKSSSTWLYTTSIEESAAWYHGRHSGEYAVMVVDGDASHVRLPIVNDARSWYGNWRYVSVACSAAYA